MVRRGVRLSLRRALLVAGAVAAAFAAATGALTPSTADAVGAMTFLAATAAATLSLVLAARRSRGPARRLWAWVAGSVGASILGSLLVGGLGAQGPAASTWEWALVPLWTALHGLVWAGLAGLRQRTRARELAGPALDAWTTTAALALIIVQTGRSSADPGGHALPLLFALLLPTLGVFLVSLAAAAARRSTPRSRAPLHALALGLLAVAASNSLAVALPPGASPSLTGPLESGLVFGTVLFGLAPWLGPVDPAYRPADDTAEGPERLLPFVVFGVSLVVTGMAALRGERLPAFVTGVAVLTVSAVLIRLWLMAAERGRLAEHLRHQAERDLLTGMPNRYLFERCLDARLNTRAAPHGVVLFLDLDGFKDVNDVYGHETGDQLLRVVADRLRHNTHTPDLVARFGGDEFAILTEGTISDAVLVAEHVRDALSAPYRLDGRQLRLTASIGLRSLERRDTVVAVLRDADLAMYRAKRQRDSLFVYEPQLLNEAVRQARLVAELQAAIPAGEMYLQYQPVVTLDDARRVASVEALVRWRHRDGVVQPARFIPAAERSGLVVPLGAWVLRESCRQLARWRATGVDLRLAVNVSPVQIASAGFEGTVFAALQEAGLEPGALTLEITEQVMLSTEEARTLSLLKRLRTRGVRIALDDFGTGYTSIGHLRKLPLDVLKIDRSFVEEMEENPSVRVVVEGVLRLARDLGLQIVAEGIERESQARWLRDAGCLFGQGFHFGRPTDAGLLAHRLRGRQPVPSARISADETKLAST